MEEHKFPHQGFYRAFEDKYRGSRELIASRLKVYLPFIEPLHKLYPSSATLDLGCGRGEWLELMQSVGFDALGIDMDEGMLDACRELNLSVKHGDAIEYLQGLAANSLSVVSAFHVVEHIPFEALQVLVQEAMRVLKPAGLLILETPNPENIRVGTNSFYLDPTHQKPIPPLLLSFIPDYYGFHRTKIVRAQENTSLHDGHVSLLDVLGGVSPDYSVVAQKIESENILQKFDAVFEAEFGLTIERLGVRYEEQMNVRIIDAEKRANDVELKVNDAEKRANDVELKVNDAELKVNELNKNYHHWHMTAQGFEQQIQSIYASRSLRITKPLRFVGRALRTPRAAAKQLTKIVGLWVLDKPKVKKLGFKIFYKLPKSMQFRLRRLIIGDSLAPLAANQHTKPLTTQDLTPRAQMIYQQIKTKKFEEA